MDLKIFQTPQMGKQVRTVIKDGVVWFVARDVAEVLEYASLDNVNKLIACVPDEWKGRNRIPTPGGEQEMATITDKGLYFFLGRSDKRLAASFQKWIAGEVVPSIMATGSYTVPAPASTAPAVPLTYRDAVAALLDALDAKERIAGELVAAQDDVAFVRDFVNSDALTGIKDAALLLGIPMKRFTALLVEDGILYRKKDRSRTLLPYHDHQGNHCRVVLYMVGEEKREKSMFTPEGMRYLRRKYSKPEEGTALELVA